MFYIKQQKFVYFSLKRKNTTILLLISITFAFICSIYLNRYYSFNTIDTHIFFSYNSENVQIENIVIWIDYNNNSIHCGFISKNGSDSTEPIIIQTSDNLRLSKISQETHSINKIKKNRYQIEGSDLNIYSIYFTGMIFGNRKSEIDMFFNIDSYSQNLHLIPVKIELIGIENILIDTIYPKPSELKPWALTFEPKDLETNFGSGKYFYLNGVDRHNSNKSQYGLLLIGTLLGILLSIISQIILDYFTFLDKQ